MRFHISFNWKTLKKFLIPLGLAFAVYLGFNTMTVYATTGTDHIQRFNTTDYPLETPTELDGLITFNIAQGRRFYLYQFQFTDYTLQQGKAYHASYEIYGGISDGFYNINNMSFEFYYYADGGLHEMPFYNLSYTGSGNYKYIEFDFYNPTESKILVLQTYNYENGTLYYSWSRDSSFGWTDLNVTKVADNSDALVSQNEVIIGQNQQQIKEQEKTNQNLEDLKEQEKETYDYLSDDTPPDSDISSLGNVQGLLPPGPVDSLLNIPFQFLSVINSSFGGVCVPYTGDFVFDSTLTLPCFSEIFYDEVPSLLLNFLSLIPASFILMQYFKHLYKKVNRAVSMETSADDEWGVL